MLKIKTGTVFLLDGLLFFISLYLAICLRLLEFINFDFYVKHVLVFLPIYLLLMAFYISFDFYKFNIFHNRIERLRHLLRIYFVVFILSFVYFYLFQNTLDLAPKTILFIFFFISFFLAATFRIFLLEKIILNKNKIKALLITDNLEYLNLANHLSISNNFNFFISDIIPSSKLKELFTDVKDINDFLLNNNIQIVVLDTDNIQDLDLLKGMYVLFSKKEINLLTCGSLYEEVFRKIPKQYIHNKWFLENVKLHNKTYDFLKRCLDIFLSLPVFLVWVFIHPFVFLGIIFDSRGEIFIRQDRFGLNGKVIKLFKYRTMLFSDKGKWITEKDNPNKITRLGSFLRKSRIDELPQVMSVLVGDISFLGPRPDILALGGEMSANFSEYMMRYSIRPGLSGWAQVNQEKVPQNKEETLERLQFDMYYLKNRSLTLDLIILFKTVKIILLKMGS